MKMMGRKTVKGRATSAPMNMKSKAPSAPTAAPATPVAKQPPAPQDVARRAFELYLARGAQPGHEVEDWINAERELGA
jgi:hypothetical protein